MAMSYYKRPLVFLLALYCLTTCCRAYGQSKKDIAIALEKAQGFNCQNLDSARLLCENALSWARTLDSARLIFHAQRTLAMIFEDNNRLAEARKYYADALDLAQKKLSETDQLTIFNDWAIINKKLGQYTIAEKYHRLTIERAEKTGDWEMVEDGYHGLGTMYSMMSAFDKSIEVYLKSVEVAERQGNKKGIVLTHQNMSNVYMKAKNLPLAHQNIEKTYQMALALGDSGRLAAVLRIYGNIESEMGLLDAAMQKLQAARRICEARNDKPRLSETLISIADICIKQQNYAIAEGYLKRCDSLSTFMQRYGLAVFHQKKGKFYAVSGDLDKAFKAFKESNRVTEPFGFKEVARENYLALATVLKQQKRYAEATDCLETANKLGEALFEDNKQRLLSETQVKFDNQNQAFQIQEKNKQIEHARTVHWLLLGGLLLTIGLLVFTWRQMRLNRYATHRIQLLMKELHHRVKNNLQVVSSIMRLQTRQITDPSVLAVLSESRVRLETIAMIHQQFYRDEQIKTLDFKRFLQDLIEKVRFTFGRDSKTTEVYLEAENHQVDVDTALPLGLIINELLTNSFKYAVQTTTDGEPLEILKITLTISGRTLHYADNGKGLPLDFDPQKNNSFGVLLINSLVRQLKGTYTFYNNNGMAFDMTFR
jgi:two-component system, sensor histidine kinase PdtaS